MPRLERGFTLIELAAVLTLMALLGALSFPSLIRGARGTEARICRDQLGGDLRFLREEALGRDAPAGAEFDAGRYFLDLGAGDPIARRFPGGFAAAESSFGAAAEGRLVFGPDGRSNGGRLVLRRPGQELILEVQKDGSFAWK